jgi:ATP-dependent DNA ligase
MVQYHVYDAIMEGSFEKRSDFLFFQLAHNPLINLVPLSIASNENHIEILLNTWLEHGYEGQMLRVPHSSYEGKRSKNLIKHKEFEDGEFEIDSIEEGKGNWAGYAKSVVIKLKDGTKQSSGVRGSQEFLKDILAHADEYTHVTVRFQNKTEDGKLRFPVVVAFWKGKRDL